MRTTAIINLKGGVGKSVTAINLAAILAGDHRQRVLLIDADSQCDTTEFFGVGEVGYTLDKLLSGDDNVYLCPTSIPDLDILPASSALMDFDLTRAADQRADTGALQRYLRSHDDYDHVIIDCPPAFSAASAAALLAADDVVIPIKLDAFSLRGMANLMRQIANMRRLNPRLTVAGILPTMYYTSNHMAAAMETLQSSKLPIYSFIRRSPKVDDMTFAQEPLRIHAPKSAAGVDYRRFAEEYLGGAE